MHSFCWALIDIETTGLHVTYDKITEIAVYIINEHGIKTKWQRLINPQRSIPLAIQTLTGISNDLVVDAPAFSHIALELYQLLEGCVLVAHNARFDYGFIKNAFKAEGISYQAPVVCTIKLLKQLYPNQPYYNLAYIAQSLDLSLMVHHRAQTDVELLYQIIVCMIRRHGQDEVDRLMRLIQNRSSLPSKLITNVGDLPESPGVYLFYGDINDVPLYIGKSISLRSRVMSHFSADHTHPKEFALSQQVVRVEVIPTAGELSALLLECQLIKEHMPVYNRKLRAKKTIAGFKLTRLNGYYAVAIERKHTTEGECCASTGLYGAFRSVYAAKTALLKLMKSYQLCAKLCHLEQGSGPCFAYQLKRCYGACINEEPADQYNSRLMDALKAYQELIWPYSGAIAIKEYCPINKLSQYSLFDNWRHMGTLSDKQSLHDWQTHIGRHPVSHSYDAYKILLSYLKDSTNHQYIIELATLETRGVPRD